MSQPAIRVRDLSKEYIIGGQQGQQTFREMLVGSVTAPFQRLCGIGRIAAQEQRFWALKDINFEVQPGEVIGVIGRNGAGKSTLLKILSRITEPTAGDVKIRGRVASLLEVGTGFHPELTGRENIFLNGAILGMSRREVKQKFNEIVSFAEVERFLDTPVKHYSSGMYVRLAFAVAGHLDPEILLVDEVLAVGDAAFQRKCLGQMGKMAKGGRTVVLISHNMEAVEGLCERAIVLSGGSVAYAGPARSAVELYLGTDQSQWPKTADAKHSHRPETLADNPALRIAHVEMQTAREAAIVSAGSPLQVEMTIDVIRPVEEVVAGWAVYSGDTCLLETRSIDSYPPISSLTPGRYVLRSTVQMPALRAGTYSLAVGLRDAAQTLDYLPGILQFRVEDCAPESLWFEGKAGFLNLSGTWTAPERTGAQSGGAP